MSTIRTYNVEAGLPTLDEARRMVAAEIKQAKREGGKVLKVIHGYGSTGKGGVLCDGLRKSRPSSASTPRAFTCGSAAPAKRSKKSRR
jgi:hypothetical protein